MSLVINANMKLFAERMITGSFLVAGDCRSKTLRQVATAASDGAMAATAQGSIHIDPLRFDEQVFHDFSVQNRDMFEFNTLHD